MESDLNRERDEIERAFALARVERPAYSQLYDFLEALFAVKAEVKSELRIEVQLIETALARAKWENGFPLLNRWDFTLDIVAAERLLMKFSELIPTDNRQLKDACDALAQYLTAHPAQRQREAFWKSFLQHELDPEWLTSLSDRVDLNSALFLARSAIRPSLELTAESLLAVHAVPGSWLRGYCPVCGSLPSLLFLEGEGSRKALCSWCGTKWDIHRLQCPYCDNRYHESLGYVAIEDEPKNRIVFCNLCKFYFKQIDTRELAYPPYLPLEEWTTLHLDLLAQKTGWQQPPSPSPAVYGKGEQQ